MLGGETGELRGEGGGPSRAGEGQRVEETVERPQPGDRQEE